LKGDEENEYICPNVVREPAELVRAGQQGRLKIISEPRAEIEVSKPELFYVNRTGRCRSSNECHTCPI